jgi:DNA-binding PadR family transcriptional regulator
LTEAVYYILLSLSEPLHGYGIMQNAERLSAGRVRLAAGTLYGALTALLERGWIRAADGEAFSRKKEYAITEQGREATRAELWQGMDQRTRHTEEKGRAAGTDRLSAPGIRKLREHDSERLFALPGYSQGHHR